MSAINTAIANQKSGVGKTTTCAREVLTIGILGKA